LSFPLARSLALLARRVNRKSRPVAAPALAGTGDSVMGLKDGGDVTPGQAYVVGEKRPELFVPNATGRIYPSVNMDRKGGSEMNVNLTSHIHTIDATGMDELLTEHTRTFQKHAALWARRENG